MVRRIDPQTNVSAEVVSMKISEADLICMLSRLCMLENTKSTSTTLETNINLIKEVLRRQRTGYGIPDQLKQIMIQIGYEPYLVDENPHLRQLAADIYRDLYE